MMITKYLQLAKVETNDIQIHIITIELGIGNIKIDLIEDDENAEIEDLSSDMSIRQLPVLTRTGFRSLQATFFRI